MTPDSRAWAVPILPSCSLSETRAFYAAAGFSVPFFDDGHYGYLIVERDGVEIQFFHHPELDPAGSHHGAYIRCVDVGEVAAWFAPLGLPNHGIPRLDPPENKPWAMREAALVDPSGNLLRMGQRLA